LSRADCCFKALILKLSKPKPQRKPIRVQGFDYSQYGPYFITICTHQKKCFFGKVVNGEMRMNEAGEMIAKWWRELKNKFSAIELDQYIIMPNHFHAIIAVGADLGVGPQLPEDELGPGGHLGPPLPRIIQWFKTMTTNQYIRNVKQFGWKPFPGKLWQRSYYEHIIRDEPSLEKIREYIYYNASKWDADRENPLAQMTKPPEKWMV
jgi:putative transposase